MKNSHRHTSEIKYNLKLFKANQKLSNNEVTKLTKHGLIVTSKENTVAGEYDVYYKDYTWTI